MAQPALRGGTAEGRWVLAAAVLGSGVAFLDGTVVNTALPAIAEELHAGLSSLQWTMTAYLLTLGSLLVLGGSLGDNFGRRRLFVGGLVGFGAASLLCAAAQSANQLIVARAIQGAAAAALVPGSLAIISSSFHPDDRARAIGAWSGLGGVAIAAGPFLGGWLIDSASWRWVFLINAPVIVVAVAITLAHVPETRAQRGRIDVLGAASLIVGLAGVVFALIEGPARGTTAAVVAAAALGGLGLVAFAAAEVRNARPMVPLGVFTNRQFAGANAVTFAVYAALGVTSFLLVVHLQTTLGYSALEAGASLLPTTALMGVFSARAGALAQRIGPRRPMTVGPLLVGAGIALLAPLDAGDTYVLAVLPAIVVLGAGLTLTVAPLTAAVLAAIDDDHAGTGSAINNAVARVASLLAIAVVPVAVGMETDGSGIGGLAEHFDRAMIVTGLVAAGGAVLAWLTIRRAAPVVAVTRSEAQTACQDPCVRAQRTAA